MGFNRLLHLVWDVMFGLCYVLGWSVEHNITAYSICPKYAFLRPLSSVIQGSKTEVAETYTQHKKYRHTQEYGKCAVFQKISKIILMWL